MINLILKDLREMQAAALKHYVKTNMDYDINSSVTSVEQVKASIELETIKKVLTIIERRTLNRL